MLCSLGESVLQIALYEASGDSKNNKQMSKHRTSRVCRDLADDIASTVVLPPYGKALLPSEVYLYAIFVGTVTLCFFV